MVSVAGIKEEEESLFTPLFTFLFDEGSEYLTCGIAAAPALKDAFLLVDADEILDCCTSCFVDRPAVDLILGLAVPLEFLLDFLFLVFGLLLGLLLRLDLCLDRLSLHLCHLTGL